MSWYIIYKHYLILIAFFIILFFCQGCITFNMQNWGVSYIYLDSPQEIYLAKDGTIAFLVNCSSMTIQLGDWDFVGKTGKEWEGGRYIIGSRQVFEETLKKALAYAETSESNEHYSSDNYVSGSLNIEDKKTTLFISANVARHNHPGWQMLPYFIYGDDAAFNILPECFQNGYIKYISKEKTHDDSEKIIEFPYKINEKEYIINIRFLLSKDIHRKWWGYPTYTLSWVIGPPLDIATFPVQLWMFLSNLPH